MEAATLSEDEATSTNFTSGSHFYEEVEDTKVFHKVNFIDASL